MLPLHVFIHELEHGVLASLIALELTLFTVFLFLILVDLFKRLSILIQHSYLDDLQRRVLELNEELLLRQLGISLRKFVIILKYLLEQLDGELLLQRRDLQRCYQGIQFMILFQDLLFAVCKQHDFDVLCLVDQREDGFKKLRKVLVDQLSDVVDDEKHVLIANGFDEIFFVLRHEFDFLAYGRE